MVREVESAFQRIFEVFVGSNQHDPSGYEDEQGVHSFSQSGEQPGVRDLNHGLRRNQNGRGSRNLNRNDFGRRGEGASRSPSSNYDHGPRDLGRNDYGRRGESAPHSPSSNYNRGPRDHGRHDSGRNSRRAPRSSSQPGSDSRAHHDSHDNRESNLNIFSPPTMIVRSPITGTQHVVSTGSTPPDYAMYRSAALKVVAGPLGADECYTALHLLREEEGKSLSIHIANFKQLVEIYKELTDLTLTGPMLASMFERSLLPRTASEMSVFPNTLGAIIAEAERAYAKASKKAFLEASYDSFHKPNRATSLTRHAVNTFAVADDADHATKSLSTALSATKSDFEFIQTLSNLAGTTLDLRKAVSYPPESTSDLRVLVGNRLNRCSSHHQALNALTNLMPKDLVRQVETTRRETSTFDFNGMDPKSLQQSHALRQRASTMKARTSFTPNSEDEEEEAVPQTDARTKRRKSSRKSEDLSTFEAHNSVPFSTAIPNLEIDSDDEDRAVHAVAEHLAHAESCAAFTVAALHDRSCHFCRKPDHVVRRCPDLLDESGVQRPYCPFCREAGHLVTKCPKLAITVCRICQRRGHTPTTCSQVT